MTVSNITTTHTSHPCYFEELPGELFLTILKFCEENDFFAIACTSKKLSGRIITFAPVAVQNKITEFVSTIIATKFIPKCVIYGKSGRSK